MIAAGECPVCGESVSLGVTHLIAGESPAEVDHVVTTSDGERMVVDTMDLELHFLSEHPELVN